MADNSTTFALANFTSVLAGTGTIAGIAAVIAALFAVVYALCFRRGRVSITRAGISIEPSPPRSGSVEAPIPSIELPPHLGGNHPPTNAIPKRPAPAKSQKTRAAAARTEPLSEAEEPADSSSR